MAHGSENGELGLGLGGGVDGNGWTWPRRKGLMLGRGREAGW